MGKNLIVEVPHQPEQTLPWEEGIKTHQLDDNDVEQLEQDRVVWKGEVAYTLEHTED